MGLRLRVSDHSSPWRYDRCCLPACTNLGQIPTGTKISELNTIQGGVASPYLSSSLPFCLRFNVELRRSRLISTLQNSIQGLGLRVTLAGTAPARSQIISSPHVHGFVMHSLRFENEHDCTRYSSIVRSRHAFGAEQVRGFPHLLESRPMQSDACCESAFLTMPDRRLVMGQCCA